MQAVQQLLLAEFLSRKILFHQLLRAAGHAFHQGIPQAVDLIHLLCRQNRFHNLAVFRLIGLSGDDIDHAGGPVAVFKQGEDKRRHAVAEQAAQVFVHIVKIGVFLVNFGHIKEAGQMLAPDHAPGFFRAYADAVLSGNHNQAAARHAQRLRYLAGKIEGTR